MTDELRGVEVDLRNRIEELEAARPCDLYYTEMIASLERELVETKAKYYMKVRELEIDLRLNCKTPPPFPTERSEHIPAGRGEEMSKHTPGPWKWEGTQFGSIKLFTPKNGKCTVMDFVRMGMQSAQPRFSDRGDQPLGGIMIDAKDLDLAVHPDARLISAAPDLLEACRAALLIIEAYDLVDPKSGEWVDDSDITHQLRTAIDKAGGDK